MKIHGQRRHVVLALLISCVFHVSGVWMAYVIRPSDLETGVLRVRLPTQRIPPERLETLPAIPVPRPLLERLRATGGPQAVPLEAGGEVKVLLPKGAAPGK